MRNFTINLTANTDCEMAALRQTAVSEVIKMAGQSVSCGTPSSPVQNAGITISLECWRDSNGKLHCKLSVSLSAA